MYDTDRARGALVGTFVGDALGMPFEGTSGTTIPHPLEMLEARLGRGTYTDDTQMMIAIAESLHHCGDLNEQHLADTFLAAYDPARGYGSGTRAVLTLIADGITARVAATRTFDGGSLGNGAAMRVAPIAVRYAGDPTNLWECARRSARITHAHPVGIDAAAVQTAAIDAALRDSNPLAAASAVARTPQLQQALSVATHLTTQRAPAHPQEVAVVLGNAATAHRSVPTAIYIATTHTDFEEAVTFAVQLGGDTDTIGAMTGAIAGARNGASRIPRRWLDALENGPKGRDHVQQLADLLADTAAVAHTH